jgi:HlyD family secretion protein
MKRFLFWTTVAVVLVGLGAAGFNKYHARPSVSPYRTMPVKRGKIQLTVNSSGTVQPVQSVQIGSFASGPIRKVHADYNDKVKKGQVLAEVDQLIPTANVEQAKASLLCATANLVQAQAKLVQAERDWKRAEKLLPQKAIADADYDLAVATYATAKASVAVCQSTIEQSEAALRLAKINLEYTIITSPCDGIITDRKIDPGQTVASTFQTPVLFVVAPDLEKRVLVLASVDEADIGMIREAQSRNEPVTFLVDAYPKDVFKGRISQVRFTPTTVQNVVTYTVVVETPNPELKLLPGLTANLTFQIDKHEKALTAPNAALRFYPKPAEVRKCDRDIVEGAAANKKDKDEDETAERDRGHKERYVWVEGEGEDAGLLRAVKITVGINGKSTAEVLSGDLAEGQMVVTGMLTP